MLICSLAVVFTHVSVQDVCAQATAFHGLLQVNEKFCQ